MLEVAQNFMIIKIRYPNTILVLFPLHCAQELFSLRLIGQRLRLRLQPRATVHEEIFETVDDRTPPWWSTISSDYVNPIPNQKQILTFRNKINHINNKKPKSHSLKKLKKKLQQKNVSNDKLFHTQLDPRSRASLDI